MKTRSHTSARKHALLQSLKIAGFIGAACIATMAQSLPQVHLDAEGLAPRPIEQLTGTAVARDYAVAWRDMTSALESGQPGPLGEEFVGFAKDHLTQRIAQQNRLGLHVHIADHGHHLKAVFYSADGSAMQIFDQAELEVQIFDGNKLLDTENVSHEYVVLMTPGADRWYVRDIEEVSAKTF